MPNYGEFLRLAKTEHSVDVFRLWIRMHGLPPILQKRVLEKMKQDANAD